MTDKIVAMNKRKKFVRYFVGPISFGSFVSWLSFTLLYGYKVTEPEMLVWLTASLAGIFIAWPDFVLLLVRVACVSSFITFGVNLVFGTLTMPAILGAVVGLAVLTAIPERWK